jgi:transposase
VNRGGGPLFIAYVEDFLRQYPPTKKTIILLDNASFHKSADVKTKMKQWQGQNLYFQFFRTADAASLLLRTQFN